ncbi:MAG TPA: hypothetical protein VN493_13050 [Thermoanaerobaculia bacterium]|nr:hypothetical protein [Thermoanaerobaculia bacterium]
MAHGGVDPYDKLAELKPEEVDFLAAVAKRAFQSVLRHRKPIYLKTDERTRREAPKDTLYVASLAFQLPDPVQHGKEMPREEHQRWSWSPKPYESVAFQGALPTWEDLPRITEDFVKACKEQGPVPHFILLNELAHSFEDRDKLKSRWVELAKSYKTYIVPGTFHCTTEFFGVAPIYCPDSRRNSYALKQNAATKMEEQIRTPDARELFVFETDFGNIVVWICLDMYDPGLVLKFLNVTHRFAGKPEERVKPKREISLVLVPAYSSDPEDNIRNCVRTISRFSKTAMVCANAYLPAGNRLEAYGFSCGEPLPVVLERSYTDPGLRGLTCEAKLYGIDVKELGKCQAANYEQNGIFSSAFSAIIGGAPYTFRHVKD